MSDNMQNEKLRLVNQAGTTMPQEKQPLGLVIRNFNNELTSLLNRYADKIPPYVIGGLLMNNVVSPIVVNILGAMQQNGISEEDTQQEETGNTAG